MSFYKSILLTLVLLFLAACSEFNSTSFNSDNIQDKTSDVDIPDAGNTEGEQSTEEEPDDDIATVVWPSFNWDNKHKDFITWNQITYDGITKLGGSLVSKTPADIISFCPRFELLENDEKKLFWISLLSAMTRYESNFNPAVSFEENFNDVEGNPVVSRGLLQLSKESSLGYGCPVNNEMDLHDPKINLECAIRILNRWVDRDGVISDKVSGKWLGGARYWAVLRKESTLNKIQSITTNFEYCN